MRKNRCNIFLKYSCLFFILILLSSFAFSQYRVTGTITNKDGKAIEMAEVRLLSADSQYIKSAFTDKNGVFSLDNLPSLDYNLNIYYFYNKILTRRITILNEDLEMGKIVVSSDIKLDGIVVTGRKNAIRQETDRIVFDLGNVVMASGGSALDALKMTPRIKVSNDKISIVGKEDLRVMINDRLILLKGEELVNFLKTINSDDIRQIEVMTNPPAKYEAEGNSGLVNIILKEGTRDSWSNTFRSAYTQATYSSLDVGNTFNYFKDKLSVNAIIDGKIGNEIYINQYKIFFPDALNKSILTDKIRQDSYSYRLGMDYNLSRNSSVGFIVRRNKAFPDMRDSILLHIYNDDDLLTTKSITHAKTKAQNENVLYNLHFDQALDTMGRKLSLKLDHFHFNEDKGRTFETQSHKDDGTSTQQTANNGGKQDIKNYSFTADVDHPTDFAHFNYGIKLSFNETLSDNSFYDLTSGTAVIDSGLSDIFKYNENVQAIYFDGQKQISEKLEIKLGLRYENTQTLSLSESYHQKDKNQYGKLFPTAFLLYTPDSQRSFNLNYGRRISRPNFDELNPFRWYLNDHSYVEGNPFLKPSYTHNIEFTYEYKQKLFSTFTLQFVEDGFDQFPMVDKAKNQQIYTRENFYNQSVAGVTEIYIIEPFQWWESTNQLNLFYHKTTVKKDRKADLPIQNGWISTFSTQNTFQLNPRKTLNAEVNFTYNAPSKIEIIKLSDSYSLDIGLKYKLLDSRLNISIVANDLLKKSVPVVTTFTNGVEQIYKNYNDNRQVRIGVSYKFGNRKMEVKERETGAAEDLNRLAQ